ncbi:MAG: MFS transporter [Clostridia bacterium]|nr:MFS transporter [Clostridia bacterium]
MKKLTYRHTLLACYTGTVGMAAITNFVPLLFLTFRELFGFTLEEIGLLVSANFITQLTVDAFSIRWADRIGYRKMVVIGQVTMGGGLVMLTVLPFVLPNPYLGALLSVITYAVGGGINEVLISPILEACPRDEKGASLSLLHSGYCWASVVVILLSTLLFAAFGMESWRVISCVWALIPLANTFLFLHVPIAPLVTEDKRMSVLQLVRQPAFLLFMLMMFCAGAAELAMVQWASAFAESGLKVTKAVGDLAGPCLFMLMMGTGRVLQYKKGEKGDLKKYLLLCAVLCTASYLIASLSPTPLMSLFGFALCGFGVSAMWPGTLSLAQKTCPLGGTAMFAILALCGDIGCSVGPALVGFVSGALGDNLHMGILAAVVFPAVMMLGLILHRKKA